MERQNLQEGCFPFLLLKSCVRTSGLSKDMENVPPPRQGVKKRSHGCSRITKKINWGKMFNLYVLRFYPNQQYLREGFDVGDLCAEAEKRLCPLSRAIPGVGWQRAGLFLLGLQGAGKEGVFQAPLEHCPGNVC